MSYEIPRGTEVKIKKPAPGSVSNFRVIGMIKGGEFAGKYLLEGARDQSARLDESEFDVLPSGPRHNADR